MLSAVVIFKDTHRLSLELTVSVYLSMRGEDDARLISGEPYGREATPSQLVVDLVATVFERVAEADGMKPALSVAAHLLLHVQEIGRLEEVKVVHGKCWRVSGRMMLDCLR